MKKKRNLKIGVLIIITLLFGYFLGTNSILKATENNIERATSAKHGYGMYLNFEYEIIQNYPYGTFVVVKDNNKNQLTVAGL